MLQDIYRSKFNTALYQTISIVVLQDDESLGCADSAVCPPAVIAVSCPVWCWAHCTGSQLHCCYWVQQAWGQPRYRAWFLAWVGQHQDGCNPPRPTVFSPLLSLFSLPSLLPASLLPCARDSAKGRGLTLEEGTIWQGSSWCSWDICVAEHTRDFPSCSVKREPHK